MIIEIFGEFRPNCRWLALLQTELSLSLFLMLLAISLAYKVFANAKALFMRSDRLLAIRSR